MSEAELIQRRELAFSLYLQMRPWIRRERLKKLRDPRAIRRLQESMEAATEGK